MTDRRTNILRTLTPEMIDIDGTLLQRLRREIYHDDDSECLENPDDDVSARKVIAHVEVDGSVGIVMLEDVSASHIDGSRSGSGSGSRITVPPQAASRLAFELLCDRFAGRENGEKEFAEYCRLRQIVVLREEL